MSTESPLFPGKRISGEADLLYGAMHPFPLPGWVSPEVIPLRGENWQVIFNMSGADYIEPERGGIVKERHLGGPSVFIAGTIGCADPAEATTVQKPLVDIIRGLLLLEIPGKPILLPPVWEGVFRKPSPEKIIFEVHRVEATALGVTPGQIHDWGSRWSTFNPLSVSRATGFSLRWYYRGMIDFHNELDERIDSFVSLWVSTITLVREWYAKSKGGDCSEVDRFVAYADQRLMLEGEAKEEFMSDVRLIYRRRNELFKGGGEMTVAAVELTKAATMAHRILEHEMQLAMGTTTP